MRNREGREFLIRKPYSQPAIDTRTHNKEPSMTKQAFAADLDANKIIKRFQGNMEAAQQFEGVYGEFDSYDLRDAIHKVNTANELFLEVPSELRAKFDNDAGRYIDFVTNPANMETLLEHGLAVAIEQQVQHSEVPPEPEPTPEP